MRAAAEIGYGGTYTADNGDHVTLYQSPDYVPDDAALQSWADFFASLIHGRELSRLTVYFAPYGEMEDICSPDADSCYSPSDDEIVLLGDPPPDGQVIEDVAAHEYGHHIANHRNNAPWDAEDWGPKYWATDTGVCSSVREGEAFPGNEGALYELNPGEAWAETYRVLNGGAWAGIVDRTWYPTSSNRYWAKQDVLHPYLGRGIGTSHGRFRRHHGRSDSISVPVDNDGTVTISVKATRGLDTDLYLYSPAGRRLAKAVRSGRYDRLQYTACGYRRLRLFVYRYKGFGRYRLKALLPYDADSVRAAPLVHASSSRIPGATAAIHR